MEAMERQQEMRQIETESQARLELPECVNAF